MVAVQLNLKSLAYISAARDSLSARDLADVHSVGMHLNALDGVTGLLIYNGVHFMQVIEGATTAIDDLLDRLMKDDRHHDLQIRDQRIIERRCFPDWSMDLLCLSRDRNAARSILSKKLPENLPDAVREAIFEVADELPQGDPHGTAD